MIYFSDISDQYFLFPEWFCGRISSAPSTCSIEPPHFLVSSKDFSFEYSIVCFNPSRKPALLVRVSSGIWNSNHFRSFGRTAERVTHHDAQLQLWKICRNEVERSIIRISWVSFLKQTWSILKDLILAQRYHVTNTSALSISTLSAQDNKSVFKKSTPTHLKSAFKAKPQLQLASVARLNVVLFLRVRLFHFPLQAKEKWKINARAPKKHTTGKAKLYCSPPPPSCWAAHSPDSCSSPPCTAPQRWQKMQDRCCLGLDPLLTTTCSVELEEKQKEFKKSTP